MGCKCILYLAESTKGPYKKHQLLRAASIWLLSHGKDRVMRIDLFQLHIHQPGLATLATANFS